MIIWLLVLVPAAAGGISFLLRSDTLRRALLVLAAVAHAGLTACAWTLGPQLGLLADPTAPSSAWLATGDTELLFLSIISTLFLCAAVYAVGYLAREGKQGREDIEEGFIFTNAREASFTGCLLLFLATMTLVAVSQHIGLLWVGVEATTLVSAPLIYFHRHHRSLEATWKYLLICSVGIALALLGNFFLAVAASGKHMPMTVANLVANAGGLNQAWLQAAFLMFLVGYGTKMGLAPLHTWLPDAHSEAPSVVSALLSGALLNCAFLAILRMHSVCVAAGQGSSSSELLMLFGLVSMGFAAVFIIAQMDYKRMLAYSSVEHMGILAFGVGVGGTAVSGAMLHAVNHSLTKGMLFLVAGNILAAYKTKSTVGARGVLGVLPISGVLWMGGFLAITGSPPFGPFVSEMRILFGAMAQGHPWLGCVYAGLLAVVFVGMAGVVLRMSYGAPTLPQTPHKEPLLAVLPPIVLGLGVLVLGVYVPDALQNVLSGIALKLGGR